MPNVRDLAPIFRWREATTAGLDDRALAGLVERGVVIRIGRGLYRRADVPHDANEMLAEVAALSPAAIFCLLTALRFHAIGTQEPAEIWIGIPRGKRPPSYAGVPIKTTRFDETGLAYGVEIHEVLGVSVPVTNVARTVVDCFRFRNKIGLDVAMEAARDVLRDRRATVSSLVRTAEVFGLERVVRSHLEVALA